MNMTIGVIRDLLFSLLEAVLICIVPLIVNYIHGLVTAQIAKIKDQNVLDLLTIVNDAVCAAVAQVQKKVDDQKAAGTFTEGEQVRALTEAKQIAVNFLPTSILEAFQTAGLKFNGILEAKIEERVREQKLEVL